MTILNHFFFTKKKAWHRVVTSPLPFSSIWVVSSNTSRWIVWKDHNCPHPILTQLLEHFIPESPLRNTVGMTVSSNSLETSGQGNTIYFAVEVILTSSLLLETRGGSLKMISQTDIYTNRRLENPFLKGLRNLFWTFVELNVGAEDPVFAGETNGEMVHEYERCVEDLWRHEGDLSGIHR